jgi:hypothetical protein
MAVILGDRHPRVHGFDDGAALDGLPSGVVSRSGSTDGSLPGRFIGGQAGRTLRAWYFRRKAARAVAGRTTRLRARVHRRSAPVWREERGSLVATSHSLRWRPLLRRWRSVDLSTATVVASGEADPAGGDGSGSGLGLPPEIDRLVVSLDAAAVVTAMVRSRRRER